MIVANAIVLGRKLRLDRARRGGLLNTLSDLFLAIFVVERVIRIVAYRSRPQDFFRSSWDTFVVAACPASRALA